jgi:hypothetical protein
VSLNRYDKHCPECGSDALDERGRVEGGFCNPDGFDVAIIECQECRHIWDTEMPMPEDGDDPTCCGGRSAG